VTVHLVESGVEQQQGQTSDALLAQDLFLQSHGIGAPTQTTAQLLVSCPLQHPGREAVFRALTAVPHLGPQAAHAIVGAFASLGPLMAAYADPGR